MCNDSWGRSSFARCLIEVSSEANLVDVVTIGIPSLIGEDFTKETILVEYEWRPPRCDVCKIFGHVYDQCPKKVVTPPIVSTSPVVTPTVEKTNDGFQTVGKKKKRKGNSKPNNGGQFDGPSVKQTVRYEPKATTNTPKKGATNKEEEVENVYDETANLFTKNGGSSFTAAVGRDGKSMQPYRNVKLGTDKEVSVTSAEPTVGTKPNKGGVDDSQPKGWWEDNEVRSNPKVNFRAMVNHEKIDNSDFVLPITAIHAMKHKFENSLVGFFVGKKVAFPLVKNYVTNTWAKFGFEKVMSDDDGVFYFKFASLKGLEQVLEQGPWLIRNIPLMLTKWSPNMSLSKDK
ncbi:zinc knuckle CX2CX4HX4C containing protein, partial [Tanacetum coccineum]